MKGQNGRIDEVAANPLARVAEFVFQHKFDALGSAIEEVDPEEDLISSECNSGLRFVDVRDQRTATDDEACESLFVVSRTVSCDLRSEQAGVELAKQFRQMARDLQAVARRLELAQKQGEIPSNSECEGLLEEMIANDATPVYLTGGPDWDSQCLNFLKAINRGCEAVVPVRKAERV